MLVHVSMSTSDLPKKDSYHDKLGCLSLIKIFYAVVFPCFSLILDYLLVYMFDFIVFIY